MLKLKVEKMNCGHCASTVQKAVKAVDPVATVNINLPSGTVSVDSAASEDSIADAIKSAGYPNQKIAS